MFGYRNLQSQIEFLQREYLAQKRDIEKLQDLSCKLDDKVGRLERKEAYRYPSTGPYLAAYQDTVKMYSCGRWENLADKCDKLQEENAKLKKEIAEAHLKNKSLETRLNESFDVIESEIRNENKLREENKKLQARSDHWRGEAQKYLAMYLDSQKELLDLKVASSGAKK